MPGLPEWGVDIPDNIRRQMGQADYYEALGVGSMATWLPGYLATSRGSYSV